MENVMTPEQLRDARRQATDAKITAWMEDPRNREFVDSLNHSTRENLIRKVCYRELKAQEINKLLAYAANHPKVRDWMAVKMAEKVADAQARGEDLKGLKYVGEQFGLLRYSFDKAGEFRAGKPAGAATGELQAEKTEASGTSTDAEQSTSSEQNIAQSKVNKGFARAIRNAGGATAQTQEQASVAKR
jgi:hypothetical protein